MKVDVVGLLSETSMHPGSESVTGVIDLPVAREVFTGYPVITGSSMKGTIRDSFENRVKGNISEKLFGQQDRAGDISFSDARLLLLPVRSLIGHYKWVTCPYVLDRFIRDLKLAGYQVENFGIKNIEKGQVLCSSDDDELFLEEITFVVKQENELLKEVCKIIRPLLYHKSLKDRLLNQLAIINDDEFTYFANFCLEVRARNKLDSKKISENLWYEECLPPDTLFYTLMMCRAGKEESLKDLRSAFSDNPYIQIGGNETVGQGWCVLSWWEEGGEK